MHCCEKHQPMPGTIYAPENCHVCQINAKLDRVLEKVGEIQTTPADAVAPARTPEMALRDWFAGQALAEVSFQDGGSQMSPDQIAAKAYLIAESMMRRSAWRTPGE